MNAARLLLVVSGAANIALLVAFAAKPSLAPASVRDFFDRGAGRAANDAAAEAAARTRAAADAAKASRAAARAIAGLWNALHSADLSTLVAQLRAAGFPPNIVRAIVSAEVENRFKPRIQELTRSLQETPYWKPDPNYYMGSAKIFAELQQIYRERSRMMRELLGQDAYAYGGMDPTAAQRRQFGDIPPEKIDLVQRITDDYAEMTAQIRTAMQGVTLPEDREQLALLEREKRADLAAVLTPEELADYEMRTSPTTSRLRTAMTIMDASEQEFRTIFQIQQQFSEVLNPLGGIMTMDAWNKRREATRQINEQLQAALRDERFAQYKRASDREFQELYRISRSENLPYETIARAYDLRDSTAEASMKIYEDRATNSEDKALALKNLAQSTRTQVLAALGPVVGPTYVENSRWLAAIQQGAAVSITPEGSVSTRRLRSPSQTGALKAKKN